MATLARREQLDAELCELLGSEYVYFNPGPNTDLHFPCIVYNTSIGRTYSADNRNYLFRDSYNVTVIDEDPDSEIPDKLIYHFPMIRKSSPFVADNLHHSPFILYY